MVPLNSNQGNRSASENAVLPLKDANGLFLVRNDVLQSLSNPICVKNAKNSPDTSATLTRERRYEPVKAEVEEPIDRQPHQPYQESQNVL